MSEGKDVDGKGRRRGGNWGLAGECVDDDGGQGDGEAHDPGHAHQDPTHPRRAHELVLERPRHGHEPEGRKD